MGGECTGFDIDYKHIPACFDILKPAGATAEAAAIGTSRAARSGSSVRVAGLHPTISHLTILKYVTRLIQLMISATSEYALRALIYLAGQGVEEVVPGRQIAAEAEVPQRYLSAILADLVRAGVLHASRGKSGGFRLTRPAEKITLHEILAPFEPVLWQRRPCPFGQTTCSDEDPCGGHEQWKKVRDAHSDFLHHTTLHDVSHKKSERDGTRSKKAKRRRQ